MHWHVVRDGGVEGRRRGGEGRERERGGACNNDVGSAATKWPSWSFY